MTPPKPTDGSAAAAADEGKETTGAGTAEEKPASTPTPAVAAATPAPPAPDPEPASLEGDENPDGYTVADLKGQARHFFGSGTSPHAVEGALSMYPDKERFTLAEARKALSTFLKREV